MKIGTVLGEIRMDACAPGFEESSWKQVRLEDRILVAADPLGVQSGDLVLVAQGVPADSYRMDLRCDAMIIGKMEKQK